MHTRYTQSKLINILVSQLHDWSTCQNSKTLFSIFPVLTISSLARASPKYWVCGLISCEQWDCPGSSSFCLWIVQSPVDLGLSTFEFNQEGERRTTVQSKVCDSPVHSWKGWLSGAVPYFQQINEREENPYLFASPLRVSVCAVETLWRLLEEKVVKRGDP